MLVPVLGQQVLSSYPSRKAINHIVDGDREFILTAGQQLNGDFLEVRTTELDSSFYFGEIRRNSTASFSDRSVLVLNTYTDYKIGYYTIDLIEVKDDQIVSMQASYSEVDSIASNHLGVFASAVTLWQDSLALFQLEETLDFYTMNWSGEFSEPIASSLKFDFLKEINGQLFAQTNKSIHRLNSDLSIDLSFNFEEDIAFTRVIAGRIFVVLSDQILEFDQNLDHVNSLPIESGWKASDVSLVDDRLRAILHRENDEFDIQIVEYQEDNTWFDINSSNVEGVSYHGFIQGSNAQRIYGDKGILTEPEKMAYSVIEADLDSMHNYAPDISVEIESATLWMYYEVFFKVRNNGNEPIHSFEVFSNFVNVPWGGAWYYRRFDGLNIQPGDYDDFYVEIRSLEYDTLCFYIQSVNDKIDVVQHNNSHCVVPFLSSVESELLAAELSIYPNPVRDVLYISTDQKFIFHGIIDINGRSVGNASFNHQQVNVSKLLPGIYFLRMSDPKGAVVYKKFVKE